MEIKILQVFYDKNGLPYKDKERTVHYPITSGTFLGASNTTQIRFYYDELDELNESTFVAVSKLPNGKIGSEILESEYDSELEENYAVLNLSQFYTQYKGDVYISLQGYQGGVRVEQDEDGIYQIYGTPTIQATGSIKLSIAYAPTFIGSGQTENITLQRVLAELSTKLGIRQETLHVEELPTVGNPNVWYVVNDDPNDTTKANIYIWNATTQTYVWVGDNTLDLGNYYTTEQGQEFEQGINQKLNQQDEQIAGLGQLQPSGVDTSTNILAFTEDKGIWVGSDTGDWYYWNGEEYVSGGDFVQAPFDDEFDETSNNAVKNKVITKSLVDITKNLWTFGDINFTESVVFGEQGTTLYSADNYVLSFDIEVPEGTLATNEFRLTIYGTNGAFVDEHIYAGKNGKQMVQIPNTDNVERVFFQKVQETTSNVIIKNIQIEQGYYPTTYIHNVTCKDEYSRNEIKSLSEKVNDISSVIIVDKGEDLVEKNDFYQGQFSDSNTLVFDTYADVISCLPIYLGAGTKLKISVNSGYRVYIKEVENNEVVKGSGFYTEGVSELILEYDYAIIMIFHLVETPIYTSEKEDACSIYILIDSEKNNDSIIEKKTNLWTFGYQSFVDYKVFGTQGITLLPSGKYVLNGIFKTSDNTEIEIYVYGSNSEIKHDYFVSSNEPQEITFDSNGDTVERIFIRSRETYTNDRVITISNAFITNMFDWKCYADSNSANFTITPYAQKIIKNNTAIDRYCRTFCLSYWNGKKIVINGDSITQGIGGERIGWVRETCKLLNFGVVRNYAIGGTRLAHVEDVADCMVDRYTDMDTDADIVFIMANTNDYASQVPIGQPNSTNPNEYNGALNIIFTWLKSTYKTQPIIISTMLTRKVNYDEDDQPLPITIEQYAQAVRDRTADYCFILYDAYKLSGLDLLNSPTDGTGITDDGLHPNKAGALSLGRKIAKFIDEQ